jgi:type IX secretion system PorP/SprF family membrane protein
LKVHNKLFNMKLFIIETLIVILCISGLCAQDIHFTQFEFSPIHVNPANTGGFNGSYRIGGIYRDQARSISNAYTTPHFYMDATFPWGLRKKDWVGFGLNFLQDKSGVIGLGRSGFIATAAYHLALGKSNSSDLALGVQFGGNSFKINSDKAKFTENFGQNPTNVDNGSIQVKGNFQDVTIGLAYGRKISTLGHLLKIGFSSAHINRPAYKLISGTGASSNNKLDMLFTGNASLQYHLNEKIDLTPMLWMRNLSKSNETSLQCMMGYLYNAEKQIKLNVGLGYRLSDAGQIMLGVDWGKIRAQIAYDQTLSQLSSAQSPNGFGAFEIGLAYIGTVIKKPNPKPKVFCPRF